MVIKIFAVFALIALPLNISMWHRSHHDPMIYRWDLTLYKSATLYLRDGLCGLYVLSMPDKVASKSEFETRIASNPLSNKPLGFLSLFVQSKVQGPFRKTWIIFPFWLPAIALTIVGMLPVTQGPIRRFIRKRRGHCIQCGYDLRGTRGRRCSECGTHFR